MQQLGIKTRKSNQVKLSPELFLRQEALGGLSNRFMPYQIPAKEVPVTVL